MFESPAAVLTVCCDENASSLNEIDELVLLKIINKHVFDPVLAFLGNEHAIFEGIWLDVVQFHVD